MVAALPPDWLGGAAQDGGHRKRVLDAHRDFIIERINAIPHLTLHGLKDELGGRGIKVSHHAVWLFLRREGLRFKNVWLAPRDCQEFRV